MKTFLAAAAVAACGMFAFSPSTAEAGCRGGGYGYGGPAYGGGYGAGYGGGFGGGYYAPVRQPVNFRGGYRGGYGYDRGYDRGFRDVGYRSRPVYGGGFGRRGGSRGGLSIVW